MREQKEGRKSKGRRMGSGERKQGGRDKWSRDRLHMWGDVKSDNMGEEMYGVVYIKERMKQEEEGSAMLLEISIN